MFDGEYLYKRRIEVGLSQTQVANELGYSVQLISLWEANKNSPGLPVISKYASLLHVDLESFIYGRNSKKNNHADEYSFNIEAFAKNLKRLRKHKGITQKELALIVGCPTNAIIRYEKGLSSPSVEQFLKIKEYYHLSIEELYFATSFDKPPVAKKRKTIIPLPIIIPLIVIGAGGTAAGVTVGVVEASKKAAYNQDAQTDPETETSSSESSSSESSSSELSSSESSSSESSSSESSSSESSSSKSSSTTSGVIEYLEFGYYPQSVVSDSSLITILDGLTTPNEVGYYEYNEEYYYKITSSYDSEFDAGYYFDDDSKIEADTSYWFKADPITWEVLETNGNEKLLVSTKVLAPSAFDTSNSNNYESSSIRTYLNDTFMNMAFYGLTSSLVEMTVDNSIDSTGEIYNPYVCNNTNDYVTMLSGNDIKNNVIDNVRGSSEFYRALGGATNATRNGMYWLRTPENSGNYYVKTINTIGKYYVRNYANIASIGIVPVVKITQ